ncbi:MAG: hypothetical protein QXK07_04975 [Desulfurococcaceae archaeon]
MFFRRRGMMDVGNFILGKFSELSVTEAHYLNLLEDADSVYPEFAEVISSQVKRENQVLTMQHRTSAKN